MLTLSLTFGLIHGTAIFSKVSDAIRHIMNENKFTVFNYIDDFLIVMSGIKATLAYEFLVNLLSELGLPINDAKLVPPSRSLTCMGINIDLDNNTLSIDEDKLKEIYEFCLTFKTLKRVKKAKYQSLCGKLLYIQRCVRSARIFLNRMLDLLRKHTNDTHVTLNDEFRKDLNWFILFLQDFNGINYITNHLENFDITLKVDACLTGIGGVTGTNVFAAPIPPHYTIALSIVHFEMLSILIAFKLWAKHWENKNIQIYSDNIAVVSVVRTSKTKDKFLATCIRNLWLLTAKQNINFSINHIPGVDNIMADTLSRIYSDSPPRLESLKYINKMCVPYKVHDTLWELNTEI